MYTTLYDWLNTTVYNSLSSDLKTVLKETGKYTYDPNVLPQFGLDSWPVAMKLFPFSAVELGLNVSGAPEDEGRRYQRFTSGNDLIKKLDNGNGIVYSWWTRSFHGGTRAILVTTSGTGSWTSQNDDFGICFGFCV